MGFRRRQGRNPRGRTRAALLKRPMVNDSQFCREPVKLRVMLFGYLRHPSLCCLPAYGFDESEERTAGEDEKGMSKNTWKAINVLRAKLDDTKSPPLSFKAITKKVGCGRNFAKPWAALFTDRSD